MHLLAKFLLKLIYVSVKSKYFLPFRNLRFLNIFPYAKSIVNFYAKKHILYQKKDNTLDKNTKEKKEKKVSHKIQRNYSCLKISSLLLF